jgi:RNA polymerase sigma-70 factor (ECF subfamily)
MIREPGTASRRSVDPSAWVDQHGDALFRYALMRVRNTSVAEDLVQDTLLAALQAYAGFAGRASERTWLIGILKHKIIDYFRRSSRQPLAELANEDAFEHSEFFRTGEWTDHWKTDYAPGEWQATPAELVEQNEFWEVFNQCLMPLSPRMASAFTLREVDGLSSDEICKALEISTTNLWVLLHRARLHLQHCLEASWFKPQKAGR